MVRLVSMVVDEDEAQDADAKGVVAMMRGLQHQHQAVGAQQGRQVQAVETRDERQRQLEPENRGVQERRQVAPQEVQLLHAVVRLVRGAVPRQHALCPRRGRQRVGQETVVEVVREIVKQHGVRNAPPTEGPRRRVHRAQECPTQAHDAAAAEQANARDEEPAAEQVRPAPRRHAAERRRAALAEEQQRRHRQDAAQQRKDDVLWPRRRSKQPGGTQRRAQVHQHAEPHRPTLLRWDVRRRRAQRHRAVQATRRQQEGVEVHKWLLACWSVVPFHWAVAAS
mmetsp:Transcript_80162/g.248792  ORF Transcript_80162/g.248792 Transcript_80162/m.248792 type:complete len:281 (+) Transcript_80162:381-1223(+)